MMDVAFDDATVRQDDLRPEQQDWAYAYHGTNYDRLRRVKAAYDPAGFFRFHQSLP